MSEALRSGVCLVGSPPERINCGLAAAEVVGFYLIVRCFSTSTFSSPQIEQRCWTVRGRVCVCVWR